MAYSASTGGTGSDLGFGMTFTLIDNFSAVADAMQAKFDSFAKSTEKMAKDIEKSMSKINDSFKNFGNGFGGGTNGTGKKSKGGGGGGKTNGFEDIVNNTFMSSFFGGGGNVNSKSGNSFSEAEKGITSYSSKFQSALNSGSSSLSTFVRNTKGAEYAEYELLSSTLHSTNSFNDLSNSVTASGSALDTTKVKIKSFDENLSDLKQGIASFTGAFLLLAPIAEGLRWAATFETIDIRLRTLLGSADEAKRVFDNLKADEPYMPFNIETLLNGNTALIAAGASADYARSSVKALANAVAATGGSTAQMNSALLNMQKIYETGFADKRHLYAFSYSAHIPMMELLSRSTGKSTEELHKMKITFKDIVDALDKAQQKGGMFQNALSNMAQTITGKLTTLKTQVMFFFANIGEAIKPIFHALINLTISLLTVFNVFLASPIGKIFSGLVQGAIIVTSFALAWRGFQQIFSSIMKMATGGESIFVIIKSFAAATWQWWIALVAVGLIFEYFNKAMSAWSSASSDVGTMYTRFEKLGGVLTAVFEIIRGMGSDGKFSMSDNMVQKLTNAGLMDTVVKLATWIARIKVFLEGVGEGFYYVGNAASEVFGGLVDSITWVFSLFGHHISSATAKLETIKMVGKTVGVVLFASAALAALSWIGAAVKISSASILAFGGWIVRTSMLLFTTLANVAGIVIAWTVAGAEIAWAGLVAFVAWLPVLALPLLIVAAIALIGFAIYEIYTHFDEIKKWFSNAGTMIYEAGSKFIDSFVEGIKSKWHSVIEFFASAWNSLPEWVKKPMEIMFDLTAKPLEAASDLLFGTDFLAKNNNIQTSQNANTQAATQNGLYSDVQTQQQPIIIESHNYTHLDGKEVARTVNRHNAFENSRISHGQ